MMLWQKLLEKRKELRMERFEEVVYEPEFEGEYENFTITDAKTADWAIDRIADERKRTKFFIECAKEEIEKLQNQIKDAEAKCENATNFLSSKLGEFLEREDVPKKETKTQLSVTLPAGKIIKKLPKIEYTMSDGGSVTKSKDLADFVTEVKAINPDLVKTKEEVDWANFKKTLTTDGEGGVIVKDSGEYIESLIATETLPSIEIKTE